MRPSPLSRLTAAQIAELAASGLEAHELTHELRQGIFAMKGIIQLGEHQGGLHGEELSMLRASVLHMEELLDSYREQASVQSCRFELIELLQEVGHALHVRREPVAVELLSEPIWIEGKALSLKRILSNLIENALAAADGVQVTVGLTLANDTVYIHVKDTGPGIPDDVLPEIFEPFVTTRSSMGGVGLGLYICRRLTRQLGGQLTITSDAGGTTAVMQLPIAPHLLPA